MIIIALPTQVCVCMEDGPCKPDPFPVRSACEQLGVPSAQVGAKY
jgi:phosphoglycolate phosphatase-like HAD superfamily hydrolase